MSTENDDHDGGEWDDPSDLTRLEDLSEFLHEEDPEVEAKLAAAQGDQDSLPDLPNEGEDLLGLDDLDDAEDGEDTEITNDTDDLEAGQGDYQDSAQFEDQGDGEETSFSEEQTNPAFDTADLDSSEFSSQDDFQSDDQDSSESFDSSESDWNDSDTSFESSENDDSESNDDDAFATSESDSEEAPEEQSWDSDDSFEEQSFDDDNDEDEDSEDQSFSSNDFESDSSESEDDNNLDFNTSENNESYDQEDDGQNQDEYQDDDSQLESNNFELPEPDDINTSPPIQAATAVDQSSHQGGRRENFQDLRDFGNAITYGVVTTGGNPPFSLILRNIKFEEDAEDIKILLREHGLVTDDNEETITQGLEQGSLLISQISEYSAIFLAHKMRRFDVELRIGLSDQLHPSKSYSREGRGLVSKYNLRQNHRESLMDLNTDIDVDDIKMSTTPTLDGYNIHRYIDVITSHTLIEEEELKRLHNINLSDTEEEEEDVVLGELLEQFPKDENADSDALQFDLGLNEIYRELVVELRNEAYKIEANGVVGINFNITPLIMRSASSTSVHYKITCSGNAVWIVDQQS